MNTLMQEDASFSVTRIAAESFMAEIFPSSKAVIKSVKVSVSNLE
jgi:hypothetical protein